MEVKRYNKVWKLVVSIGLICIMLIRKCRKLRVFLVHFDLQNFDPMISLDKVHVCFYQLQHYQYHHQIT